jgi:hypothetical protein
MISPNGKINFYPPPPAQGENAKLAPSSAVHEEVETSADDLD